MIQIIGLSKQSRLFSQGIPCPFWVAFPVHPLWTWDEMSLCHSWPQLARSAIVIWQHIGHFVLAALLGVVPGCCRWNRGCIMRRHQSCSSPCSPLQVFPSQTSTVEFTLTQISATNFVTFFFFFPPLPFPKHPVCRHRGFHQSGLPVHCSGAGHDAERALCQIR